MRALSLSSFSRSLPNVSQFCINSLICLPKREQFKSSCVLSTSSRKIALFSLDAVYILRLPAVAVGAKNCLSESQVKLNSFGTIHITIENVFSCTLTIDKLNSLFCCQNSDRSFSRKHLKWAGWKLILFYAN